MVSVKLKTFIAVLWVILLIGGLIIESEILNDEIFQNITSK